MLAASSLQTVSDELAAAFRDDVLPEWEVRQIREHMTLAAFAEKYVRPDRIRRMLAGDLARGTIVKDNLALSHWQTYTRPDVWPIDVPWEGPTLAAISESYVQSIMDRMQQRLQPATIHATWNHLRAIFGAANRLGVLNRIPTVKITEGEEESRVLTDGEINAVYRGLNQHAGLQVAFVLAINAGLRSGDLFGLRWGDIHLGEAPSILFVAQKTGKRQRIPLAPATVRQLERLPQGVSTTPLFPEWSNLTAADPERSRAARTRRVILNAAFVAAGINVRTPGQASRATCGARLEEVTYGAGQFVLGTSLTLHSAAFDCPTQLVRDAVNRTPQPREFLREDS